MPYPVCQVSNDQLEVGHVGNMMDLEIKVQLTFALLAFIAKYGVPTSQWTWLYEVSMTKITLWIRVYVDDWTAKGAVKASNEGPQKITTLCWVT